MKTMTSDDPRRWLEAQILAEHSKPQTMRIVHWVGQDAERLRVLMEIFLDDPPAGPLPEGRSYQYIFTQRSAWAVRYVGERSPILLAPWLPRMVKHLRQPALHAAVKRNVMNVFEHLEIPPVLFDELADIGFGYLADSQEAIAVRCASMTVLDKICRDIPELHHELRLLLEEHLAHGSSAFKNRARKILAAKRG
jgi:hypothetical protein